MGGVLALVSFILFASFWGLCFFLSYALSGNWGWVRAGAFDNGVCILTASTFVVIMIVNDK